MHYSVIIFSILAYCCSAAGRSQIFKHSEMVFSDALPVQFWDINCQTYNEKLNDGVHYRCFCQPWQCDDEIIIQFQDNPNTSFSLVVYEEDELREAIEFDEIASGLYQLTFTPTADDSPEYCDSFIQLRIRQNAGEEGVSLPSLSDFTNDGGSGDPWTLGATPSIATSALGTSSEGLIEDFAFIPGVQYTLVVNFTNTNNTAGLFTVAVSDSSDVVQFSESTSGGGTGANVSDALIFTATASTTRIRITLTFAGSSQTTTITSLVGTRSIGTEQELAKSDCLHILTEHKNTVYASYTYHRNYAGLVYSDISPAIVFKIRIPAIFFHQRFPEEDETILLTDQVVTLNGTMRKQRLLETDYLPYYFHEKIMLILKQNVEIFDFTWVKQEAYQITEGNRKSPLKIAKVWLSRQDFVQRNVL
jgi:hypothetical protein